jgi:hypothetical protein
MAAMTRKPRRFAAWLGILGIAFAQVAVTAQACLTGAALHASAAKAVAMAHEGHCDGGSPGAVPMAPNTNACEVQCTDGAPTGAAPDLPPVMLTVLPAASGPIDFTLPLQTWDRMSLEATRAQPPPQLQFVRFLN